MTIQVESAQDYVYHMLARSIESGVAKVERASAPRSDVDLNLVPELSVEATGMLSHTCTARFSLSLLDKNGRLLASNQHEAAMDYVAVADGGPACHQAIVTAVETASPPVLRAIDQAP